MLPAKQAHALSVSAVRLCDAAWLTNAWPLCCQSIMLPGKLKLVVSVAMLLFNSTALAHEELLLLLLSLLLSLLLLLLLRLSLLLAVLM